MTYEEYRERLMSEDPYITQMYSLPDDRYAIIKRLMFHWTIITGSIHEQDGYEDRWCYETQFLATLAIAEWCSRYFLDEPKGWHKHPATERRQPAGTGIVEYV